MREGTSTPSPVKPVSRRVVLGLGVGAVVAGAGVGLWRHRPGDVADGAADSLWNLSFQTPNGATLAMASLKGKPLLVNFWATWCPPCVEEMPMLDAFFRQQSASGWQVIGLAIDQPSAVRTFLQRTPVSFPIGLAGMEGTGLGKTLGNQTGGLPFTVILDSSGAIRERRMGRVTEADLQAWSRLR